jgi:hypothetical protein
VTSSSDGGADEVQRAALFADRLRDAHRKVAALEVDVERKSSITRRLLVISDASKHSVERAARRLDVLLAELEEDIPRPSA